MRPPCPAEPHMPNHNKPAPRHHTQPSPPQNLQVSHWQPGNESQLSQHAAISMLPGPGTHWDAEKQSRGCLKPFPDTAMMRPSLTCRVSLAHSLSLLHAKISFSAPILNSSPIGIAQSFCKHIQLFSSPFLPLLLATSYYPCFCPDCWTHAFLFLLAPFSLMAAQHIAPLHPFFHLRNLYPTADSHGM